MSAANLFSTRKKAFDLREKVVNTTYAVRVGATPYNFIVDRVITVTNPAANFTITLPNGSYFGQEILIALLSNDEDVTVTVYKTTPGASVALGDVGDYASFEYVNDIAGWILLHYELD